MKFLKKDLVKGSEGCFDGNQLPIDVWISKYAMRSKNDPDIFYEKSPNETIDRLVDKFLEAENKYEKSLLREEIKDLLAEYKHAVPGGSIIYGLGNNESLSSLGNCFVIGNKTDSYGSICFTDQEQIQLMKRRGGVGHDLSHLRPDKSPVNSSARTSTGAVSFAPRYSHSTGEVAQDGRRGALMLSFHIKHPDSLKFINLKTDRTTCTKANISLKLDDEFLHAIENKSKHYIQQFPIDSTNPKFTKIADPLELWSAFCKNAHGFAEPGALFWDTISRESIPSCYGEDWEEISTNPCGEIPLCPYDSCRLFAINLYSFVKYPFTEDAFFDYEEFEKKVDVAMRLMDDVIDLEEEKIMSILNHVEGNYEDKDVALVEINLWKKVLKKLREGRRTGLGIMGGADALAALGYKYGTKEATQALEDIMKSMAVFTYKTSIYLAKERGAFPIWDINKEKDNPFLKRILNELDEETLSIYREYGRRNIACLTVAPTGSISILAQVNGGFEPVFMLAYNRNRKVNPEDEGVKVDFVDEVGDSYEKNTVIHKPFGDWYEINLNEISKHFDKNLPSTIKELFEVDLDLFNEVSKLSPYYKCTANEIDVYEKIRMQGRIQKWIDHSISITHNLPENFPLEEISKIYLTAWKSGCKGCTVYRDGSRMGVLTKLDKKEEEKFKYKDAVKRPKEVECDIHCTTALREKWIVLVGKIDNHPYEVFSFPKRNITKKMFEQLFDIIDNAPKMKDEVFTIVKKNKRKYSLVLGEKQTLIIEDIVSLMENDNDRSDTKRISLELRHGIDPKFITQTIEKQYKDITAFDNAIARVLKFYIKDGDIYGMCPSCKKSKMVYQNGCPTCPSCGYSSCG